MSSTRVRFDDIKERRYKVKYMLENSQILRIVSLSMDVRIKL